MGFGTQDLCYEGWFRKSVHVCRCGLVAVLMACGNVDDRSPLVNGESSDGNGVDGDVPFERGGDPLSPPSDSAETAEAGSAPLDEMTVIGDQGSSRARLSADDTTFDFGGVRAAGELREFDWVITNIGTQPTVDTLVLTNSNEVQFIATNGCATALAPGASCAVHLGFRPQEVGTYTGELRLTHGTELLTLTVKGKGQYQLTVNVLGRGEVSSSPPGLSCDSTSCVGLFDPVEVTLTARTNNGSNSVHFLWSVSDCRANQSCRYTPTSSTTITTSFAEITNNLVFTSSELFPVTLGSLAAYDVECNRLASAAGINDADGAGFIAAMSSSTISLRERLSGARGWVRMDSLPVADTVDDLFNGKMRYYVAYDETGGQVPTVANALLGRAVTPGSTLSGTAGDGTAVETCNDWTSGDSSLRFRAGRPSGGPFTWIDAIVINCDLESQFPITCMGVRRSAPVVDLLPDGAFGPETKRIWVSNTEYSPGTMTPDEKCQSELPAGVDRGVAFIAYRDRSAAAVLDPEVAYIRPDGAFVGRGADLTSLDIWTGPWVLADGSISPGRSEYVWMGAASPEQFAIIDGNCEDWRSTSGELLANVGDYGRGGARFFRTIALPCNGVHRLYCVEP
jgi:hypothetical protein